MGRIIKAVVAMALIAGSSQVQAQGSAGTGNTSTGIGAQVGPAGPGRRGDLTQQPGTATNRTAGSSNLSPAQKNAIPPPNAPANANRAPK
jgi:hypothetical protein